MRLAKTKSSLNLIVWLLPLLCFFLFEMPRLQWGWQFLLYAVAFAGYVAVGWLGTYRFALTAMGVLGVASLWYFPQLSDDIYRFYWDAWVGAQGIGVYAYTPEEILQLVELPEELLEVYGSLNSQQYYAVYTPLNIALYQLPIELFEVGFLGFLVYYKLLQIGLLLLGYFALQRVCVLFHQKPENAWWFYGNPLVWVEGLGNLHIELVLVSLVFCAIALGNRNFFAGVVVFLIAVGLKFSALPFLITALFLVKWTHKRVVLTVLGGLVMLVGHLCVLSWTDLLHIKSSLLLFSQTFEFNGLVYYAINGVLSHIYGYNAIAVTGSILSSLAALICLILCFRMYEIKFCKNEKVQIFAWIALVVLLLATTVHPWYLIIPLAALPFTRNMFLLAWSYTVFLSYLYYQNYELGFWIILEYLVPLGVLLYYKYGKLGTWMKFHDGRF